MGLKAALKALFAGPALPSHVEAKSLGSSVWPSGWVAASPASIDKFDYGRATGPISDNSVVRLGVQWVRQNLTQGRIVVGTEDDGDYNPIDDHPLTVIFRRPNKVHSWPETLGAIGDDLILWGNAFAIKSRDGTGEVRELQWVPRWAVDVVPETDPARAAELGPIRCYLYFKTEYPPSEVIHFREGIDPARPWMGMSCLNGQERNAAIVTAAEKYTTFVLLNAHAGKALMPREGQVYIGSPEEAAMNSLAASVERGVSGPNAGRFTKLSVPMDLLDLGMGPEEMALDRITNLAVAMILAAMNLNAKIFDLPSSEQTSTYANYGVAIRGGYTARVLPMKNNVGETLVHQLLVPDFGDVPGDSIWFDDSDVQALSEDDDAKADRQSKLADIATINERRALVDLPEEDWGDEPPNGAGAAGPDPQSNMNGLAPGGPDAGVEPMPGSPLAGDGAMTDG